LLLEKNLSFIDNNFNHENFNFNLHHKNLHKLLTCVQNLMEIKNGDFGNVIHKFFFQFKDNLFNTNKKI
jgi:hypothetical protein